MRQRSSALLPILPVPILRAAGLAVLCLLVSGCGSGGLGNGFFEASEYERYVDSLENLELDRSTMGSTWIAAGKRALDRPQSMKLPWHEEIFFSPERPTAVAWQVSLEKGRRLRAVLETPDAPSARAADDGDRFFLQLFEVRAEDEPPEPVAEAGRDGELTHDVTDDATFLLRLQPELLAGGRVTLEVTGGGQLTFPVEGRDARAIGSGFGDPRDGGRRRHHGVDIFAPRGTPTLAAVDGLVTRVGTNRLGGNVIWMRGDGKSFYYAHLEEQLVGLGRVSAGEAIGRVGNSGNARTTLPHLHFGLYDGGPVDPAPYLASPGTPPSVTADRDVLGQPARVLPRQARLRSGPSTSYEIRDELPRRTAVHVEAANGGWYRIRLADGCHGYMSGTLLHKAEDPLRHVTIEDDALLLHLPSPSAPRVGRVAQGERIGVLGELDPYLLVETAEEVVGWIPSSSASP